MSETLNHKSAFDYLTFVGKGFSVSEVVYLCMLATQLPGEAFEVENLERGSLGWTNSAKIMLAGSVFAFVLYGGESQRGSVRVEFKGEACQKITKWGRVHDWLQRNACTISRVDLAVDLLGGERGLDQALLDWQGGGFTNANKGRPPSMSQAGNWVEPDGKGRTLYVGSKTTGKQWCIYEKGKQLGDETSPWVRWELRYSNHQRIIPLDILLHPDNYFVGAAPVANFLLSACAAVVKIVRRAATIRLDAMIAHVRRSYGQFIQYLHLQGIDSREMVDVLRRPLGEKAPRWVVPQGTHPGDLVPALIACPF